MLVVTFSATGSKKYIDSYAHSQPWLKFVLITFLSQTCLERSHLIDYNETPL